MNKLLEKIKRTYPYRLTRYIYKKFFFGNMLFFLFCISLLITLTTLFIVSFRGRPEEAKIPLHYIVGVGIDKTGNWYEIYYLPAFGAMISIANFIFSILLYKKRHKTLSFILMSSTIFFSVILLFISFTLVFNI